MSDLQNQLALTIEALKRRGSLEEGTRVTRLFNGFYEGIPDLVLDRYGRALVIFDHSDSAVSQALVCEITDWALAAGEGLDCVLLKQRQHPDEERRKGILISGKSLPDSAVELGICYALDLRLNQDASFYPDTRGLRRWLLAHAAGKRVLNTFAYTGSLGVAAGVGGAARVVQTDLNRKFLNLARKSWALNNLNPTQEEIIAGDFFRVAARLRRAEQLFDILILDPPFFSATKAGRVDLQAGMTRLINKLRPLAAHESILVVINNALFLSGAAFKAELDRLCQSEYLSFEGIIPIPPEIMGYPETIVTQPPADPAPFNHPTKIALLHAYRKDGRR